MTREKEKKKQNYGKEREIEQLNNNKQKKCYELKLIRKKKKN
jgi:hypothetical protein